MDTENSPPISLEAIAANRRLIDDLWSQKLISTPAKEFALDRIYPPRNWGLWASRMLLVLGITLILSGMIYFFAFNWNKMTPLMKLGSIQMALAAIVMATYFYRLKRLPGQLLLLSAMVLVGVFLAVFGQIYQTGADAYTLFLVWALLTLPWVFISDFSALWLLWLVIVNLGVILFWLQTAADDDQWMMIFSYLALLNSLFLVVKEYASHKGLSWLKKSWTTVILVLPILGYAFIPTVSYIMDFKHAHAAIALGTMLAIAVHIVFYLVYRYRLPNIGALAVTLLSAASISMVILWKILDMLYNDPFLAIFAYLLMGCATLGIFTTVIVKLRAIDKEMKGA